MTSPDAAGQGGEVSRQHPAPDDIAELQREIEQTRERLGGTVAQLAAKADLKRLAKDEATHLKAEATNLKAEATDLGARVQRKISHARPIRRMQPQVDGISLALLAAAATSLAIGSFLLWRYGPGNTGGARS